MFLSIVSKLPRWFSLGLVFPLLFLNGWLLLRLIDQLEPLVSILISATLIAFLLDYPIRFLEEQAGIRRGTAVGLVFLLFVVVLIILLLFLGPVILRQASELLTRLPDWIDSGQRQLQDLENWAVVQQLPFDLRASIDQFSAQLTTTLRSVTRQLVSLIFSTIDSIANVFLTIVFAIFLVIRGQSLWSGVLGWLPVSWNEQVREYLPDNFERYIVGQVTLATILGTVQTITLFILGVPFAILFGFAIGAASLIPLGGILGILVVSLLVGLQSVGLGIKVLIVTLIVGQINENLLAPRIVGELTGLNPVWTLISVLVGFKLKGTLGVFIAVPLASFIKGTFDRIRKAQAIPAVLAIPETTVSTELESKILE